MSHACHELHTVTNKLFRFRFPYDTKDIPKNGLYVLFENGEEAHGGGRIVQIGKHTTDNRLPARLDEHFRRENKEGSILRKHVGRCLLKQNNDPYFEVWDSDTSSKENSHRIIPGYQQFIENKVTRYIQENFSFCILELTSDMKARLISTVFACKECSPSADWLGRSWEKTCRSGLWHVNELNKQPLTTDEVIKIGGFFVG